MVVFFIALGAASVVREVGFSKLQSSGYDAGDRSEGFLEKLCKSGQSGPLKGMPVPVF